MKIIGGILIVLAFVVAIVPMFTDCQSQGRALVLENGKTVAMKCHWSGVAELAMAIPLFVLGVMEIVNRSSLVNRYLSILGVVFGVFIVLIPTELIGVCLSADMVCNSTMRPVLILGGILVVVASLFGLYISIKTKDNPTK